MEVAIAAIRAELDKPLQGPQHGVWDRGRRSGLEEALWLIQSTAAGLSYPPRQDIVKDFVKALGDAVGEHFDHNYERAWESVVAEFLAPTPVTDDGEDQQTRAKPPLFTIPGVKPPASIWLTMQDGNGPTLTYTSEVRPSVEVQSCCGIASCECCRGTGRFPMLRPPASKGVEAKYCSEYCVHGEGHYGPCDNPTPSNDRSPGAGA